MPPNSHAILSASSSHRWMNCTPSARLERKFADRETEAAAEGTAAHALCEHKLRRALKMRSHKPVSKYDCDEMDAYTDGYVEFVLEQLAQAKLECADPLVLIEQRLDFSYLVPEGFGSGDCIIVADKLLHIIDFKYGQGVLVEAEENPQMMLYALGALQLFDSLYDITEVSMSIYQVSLPYKQFLGYEKGPDDIPVIVEEEAIIVRRIYSLFMAGKTPYLIAKALTAEGIPTPAGKNKWGTTTVASILTNEKYKGAALLQKKFTVDFLEKKMKVNEGEVPQYYIEESHQPIIDPDEFDRVQAEFARRKGLGHRYSGNSIFASRIVCGDCGTFYGSKVWHSNSKYRRTIWQCNGKFKGAEKCRTPHLLEEDIKARFLVAFNKLLGGRNTLLDDCRLMQSHLTDCSAIDAELEELRQEIEVVTELTQRCIQENARSAQSQEEYTTRYNGYVARYDSAKAKLDALQQKKDKRLAEAEAIGEFMFALSERDCELTEFDEGLWLAVVEKATVFHDGRLVFTFQNGTEIEG